MLIIAFSDKMTFWMPSEVWIVLNVACRKRWNYRETKHIVEIPGMERNRRYQCTVNCIFIVKLHQFGDNE